MTTKNTATPTLKEWFKEAPFSLTMTSGFFGFFAHCGVLYVLEQEGLLPNRVTGSSAGALVTGCWAAGVSAEALSKELLKLKREDFWDLGLGLGLLKGKLFQNKLYEILPNHQFEDCRVPAAFSVFELGSMKTRVIQTGDMIPVIQASCAFPFMFQPVKIGEKRYLDGGIADRPGLLGMPEGERTFFHHLASKSPWRSKGSSSLKIPKRSNMTTLVIQDLPRVNPFQLPKGHLAFEQARIATEQALHRPIIEQNVIV